MSRVSAFWSSFSSHTLSAAYPEKCAICNRIGSQGPCETCVSSMMRNPDIWLEQSVDGLRAIGCCFHYDGAAAECVRQFKYQRVTALAEFMRASLHEALAQIGTPDLLIPVPIHWRRKMLRGFNQSDLLAYGGHGLPVDPSALVRIRPTKPQAGLSASERTTNLRDAFRASPLVAGKDVLLIEDVITTGQTVRECARTLLAAGARSVRALAFAGDVKRHTSHHDL